MTLLKEFELCWPGQTKERKREFQLQTRCVTALFERLFPKFRTANCWKVLAECVGQSTREQYRNQGGVYVLETETDVDHFFYLPDEEKKRWTLETLRGALDRLVKQTDWPAEPFLDTYRRARFLNLVNRWVWRKPILSPSRRFLAEVLIEHEVQACDISIVVSDRNKREVARDCDLGAAARTLLCVPSWSRSVGI
jgi:hypothetical protein